MFKLNGACQILQDIIDTAASDRSTVRVFCRDGRVFDGIPDCRTYVDVGDDEDVDALSFILQNGSRYDVGGVEIERFEPIGEQ